MTAPRKARLDHLVVERGLARSTTEAQRLIRAGLIQSGTEILDKPGTAVAVDRKLSLKARPRFVGRGGEKLEHALAAAGRSILEWVALDIGASTGGFTDCLLQRGARHVFAVDVGRGLIDSRLREDPRVTVIENKNCRYLTAEWIGKKPVDIVTIDVSFISLSKFTVPLSELQKKSYCLFALIKPQFEVGREWVGKGGIVRDAHARERAILKVIEQFQEKGFQFVGRYDSIPAGFDGNQECFAEFHWPCEN